MQLKSRCFFFPPRSPKTDAAGLYFVTGCVAMFNTVSKGVKGREKKKEYVLSHHFFFLRNVRILKGDPEARLRVMRGLLLLRRREPSCLLLFNFLPFKAALEH